MTCAVLQGPDPGPVTIGYATANHISHIVLGASDHSTARCYLGSFSTHEVAEAHCSMTVVRVPERREGVAQA